MQTLGVSDEKITAVELPMRDGAPKGYAVVGFQDRKLVNLAIEVLDGFEYNGQKLKVKQDQDQKTLMDVRPRHPTIDSHNVPSIDVGSFRDNISEPTALPDAQNASHSPNTVVGTRGSPHHSAQRSTSCQKELSNSSRSYSDPSLASPPVVNGSKSRLIGNASTNGKDQQPHKLGSGSASKPSGGQDHSRKVHKDSPSARRGGSDNLKGSKKRR